MSLNFNVVFSRFEVLCFWMKRLKLLDIIIALSFTIAEIGEFGCLGYRGDNFFLQN